MFNRKFKIFIDFDGTISTEDVSVAMFKYLADENKIDKIINEYRVGNISAVQCWENISLLIPNVEKKELEIFLDKFVIDSSFVTFVKFCKENNLDLTIISDGFDFYIRNILIKENLSELNFYSNNLVINEKGNLSLSFPFTDEECKDCANCKRNHILGNSSDEDITIYIGNGKSDFCPAQFCDFIFAKEELLKFCEKERISYFPFKNFNDVELRIKELLNKKNIKKRHQAELKRRAVYLQG